MDDIRTYAAALCIACAAISVARAMTASKKFDGIIQMILGAFFLIAIITPIKNLGAELSEFTFNTTSQEQINEDKINEQIGQSLERELTAKLGWELERKHIQADEINLNVEYSSSNVIKLDKFSISINTSYKNQEREIMEISENLLGITPEIIFT